MAKISRICEYCKKEFKTTEYRIKDGRGKFCSKNCFDDFRRGKPNLAIRTRVSRECLFCGKQFYEVPNRIKDGRGKYCSKECSNKVRVGKPSGRYSRVTKVCIVCGKEFLVNKARLKSAKFCSTNCYAIYLKGKPSWSKGLKRTIEQKKRFSIAQKKRFEKDIVWNKGTKGVMKAWNKGKSWSEEQRKKLSQAHMGGKTGYSRFQKISLKKGWKIISPEQDYKNNKSRLKCECIEGHKFSISLSKALNNQDCSNCSKGVSERTCRWYFEHIFKEGFPNVRPDWLIGPKGFRLELDGYCEKFKLAFEFQGRQHYKENKFFHGKKSRQSFEERKTYDEIKRKLCSERGITLVEIPDKDNVKGMDKVIIEECMKAGVDIPETDWYNSDEINVNKPNRLKELQNILYPERIVVLSTRYVNNNTKVKLQCREGHNWEATPGSIKSGHRCPSCVGLKKGTIEEMQEIAKSREGYCISTEYKNNRIHLLWKCKEGHEWIATPSNIKRGKWCPRCGAKRAWEKRRNSQRVNKS